MAASALGLATQALGDTNAFLSGVPRIAGAWTDLNPHSGLDGHLNQFPVQAVGFAGVNHFKLRWINVPE